MALLLGSTAIGRAQTPVGAHLPATLQPRNARFAVIGDYGVNTANAANVGLLVDAFTPDWVITVGDNNYSAGEQATIDVNIGQYYANWIHPYVGGYASVARRNRFFPSLGNHDWGTPGAAPYLAYFTLPGNERYYDFRKGAVHCFALDSDPHEPDGISASSTQALWLQSALAASNAPFKIVYFHHPPFSSAVHGSTWDLQWPFRAWGADAVLSGHDHDYERLIVDGFPYIVNGLGGNTMYTFRPLLVGGSEARFNTEFGAMLVDADDALCTFRFLDIAGTVIDECSIRATPLDEPDTLLLGAGSTWKYVDDGSNQGTAWRLPGFDDTAWASGPAQLGYGDGDETTVIQGGPAANHFVTSYFRRTFQVATPADFRVLRLELLRDDGAAVFLNGQEIVRDNLAANATYSTYATATSNTDENLWHPYDVSPAWLFAGANTLAVEVHQVSATSSDVSFDARLTGFLKGTELVARGSTWKVLDTGVDPGATWASAAFDDSLWTSGPAQLGYGEGDEQTVVSFGPNPLARPITTWFRRTFQAANPAAFAGLRLELLRDDGAVVWINGKEAYRSNLVRASNSATTAGYDLAAPDENAFATTLLDPRLLLPGANVIAVELHQFSAASDDLSFDLALLGL
ncbi:MAG: metallophosphoesterase [Planctomycetes bacterium]|nr:metallophosphoesterase [Planctomycetota bacterium]